MKKILFIMACMTGVFMASCEKDPDMGELDADLVVYTDHDSNTDFSSFQTYFLPDSIWKQVEYMLHTGRMRMLK